MMEYILGSMSNNDVESIIGIRIFESFFNFLSNFFNFFEEFFIVFAFIYFFLA